jgi:hypothetical protein
MMTIAVRGQGKTGGAFGFALNFWLPFVSRQKVEKDYSNEIQIKIATSIIDWEVPGQARDDR